MSHRKRLCGSGALDAGDVEELMLEGISNFTSIH
jgi:hypothetical protein